jgi:hypothetical protein
MLLWGVVDAVLVRLAQICCDGDHSILRRWLQIHSRLHSLSDLYNRFFHFKIFLSNPQLIVASFLRAVYMALRYYLTLDHIMADLFYLGTLLHIRIQILIPSTLLNF